MYITLFACICQVLFLHFFVRILFRKILLTFLHIAAIIIELNGCMFASVAQSVVHLTRNEKVACSSQVTSSKLGSIVGSIPVFCSVRLRYDLYAKSQDCRLRKLDGY